MARRFVAPTLALLLFALVTPIVAERAPVDADVAMRHTPGFSGLEPGAFVTHTQTVRHAELRLRVRCRCLPRVRLRLHGHRDSRVGHHIGMSHPHDGFDPETGVDFGAENDFFFAWAGDESDTVMHYLTLSNQFGEHNRDNMYRWEAAGYLNWANELAGAIPDSAQAPHARLGG